MSTLTIAPAATERLFPTCADWCQWHDGGATPEDPGSCWAEDIKVGGTTKLMATWDENRVHVTRTYLGDPDAEGFDYATAEFTETEEPRPPLSITVYRTDVPLDEGVSFDTIEQAEATAHAILAMTARLRGDEQLAEVHLTAAATAATSQEDRS